MKTLDDLKKEWLKDPCWDIEDTEGFEDYYEELRKFREEKVVEWAIELLKKRSARAESIGLPDNLKLSEVIHDLMREIEELRERVHRLEEKL